MNQTCKVLNCSATSKWQYNVLICGYQDLVCQMLILWSTCPRMCAAGRRMLNKAAEFSVSLSRNNHYVKCAASVVAFTLGDTISRRGER